MREVGVEERRRRLARRQRLAPGCEAERPEEVAHSLVALHATDPATVYLSAWARTPGFEVADLERCLYGERSLVKHLAMRGTLFVMPVDSLRYAQAGASERVAGQERRRLIKEVERAGLRADGERWLTEAGGAVLGALAGGREASSSELRRELPGLAGSIAYGEGKSWAAEVPVGPRVLTLLAAEGRVVRGSNAGAWSTSRPRWTRTEDWLGEPIAALSPSQGMAWLVEAWLRAFGPGTEADIRWWLGSTLTAVRTALEELGAVEVSLGGETGYLLADDLEPVGAVGPWAALLPSLDPTTMGWLERDWYLGPHAEHVFDRNGNAGHTAWLDGRIVGGWRQGADGEVELQLLEDVGSDGLALLEAEAERLSGWFSGQVIAPRFPAPLAKRGR